MRDNWRVGVKPGEINCEIGGTHLLSDQLLLTEGVAGLVTDVVHWPLVHLERKHNVSLVI